MTSSMKVSVLVDNNDGAGLKGEWGLSFYIEYEDKTVLLDAGLSPLFAENAEAEEIPYIYSLFRLSTPQSSRFTDRFCAEWLQWGKQHSDYSDFCTFLRFVFTELGADELQVTADRVHKLNSRKLEQLKLDAETAFASDFAMKEKFELMLSMQPKKRSFFDLFRK